MPPTATATNEAWLSAKTAGKIIGVDREKEIIHGYIVAQEGPFKSEGRGEFDLAALKAIVKMINASPKGLKSRFTHPDMSNDGLGKFLGRVRGAWLDKIAARESEGQLKTDEIHAVRADLVLDPVSHSAPSGDLGAYVMDLAESDPDALSSSLVLKADQEYRIDKQNRRMQDEAGNELPPLWRPTALHASDVVDTGDAVDGMLSVQLDADGLPDGVVRRAAELMDRQFAGQARDVVQQRCTAWLDRYLTRRYGPAVPGEQEVDDAVTLADAESIGLLLAAEGEGVESPAPIEAAAEPPADVPDPRLTELREQALRDLEDAE